MKWLFKILSFLFLWGTGFFAFELLRLVKKVPLLIPLYIAIPAAIICLVLAGFFDYKYEQYNDY